MCGISHNGVPLSVGVFFDRNLVLTSANPIQPYLSSYGSLTVHSIIGDVTATGNWSVTCAITSYAANRNNYWVPLGKDKRHSGIHDLVVLFAYSPDLYHLAPEAINASYRHAFSPFLAQPEHRLLTKGITFAGFGFIDQDHVNRMNDLELEIYDGPVLVDCDDYMPREWGRFICISNLSNATGVQSGSPLFHRSLIFGIGSFALEKGEDKIFVFTDVRDYVYSLYYCEDGGGPILWHSRYWAKPRPGV